MGSFSIWHWLVVLLIILLVFGTRKLRGMGTDLGHAVRNFKDGMKMADDDNNKEEEPLVIEGQMPIADSDENTAAAAKKRKH